MTPTTNQRFRPNRASMLFLAAFVFVSPLRAQEPQYTAEEYKAYEDATKETDVAKKTELLVAFLKERPKSTLREHIIAAYQAMMNNLHSASNWKSVIASGELFLTAAPNDIYTISLLTTAYQESKNPRKFVQYGEKVFAQTPQGNTAYYLAKAYQDLKNDAKFLQWAEKTVELLPDNYEMLLELTKAYAAGKRNPQASKYGKQCIKTFQSAAKPEAVSDKDWKAYANNALASCNAIVGNVAFEQQDYNSAVTYLESSLKYFSRNDMAYYYLGQAYWQTNKLDLAMLAFAKGYLLNGSSSPSSKQHLENLYRSTHRNSLVGLERVIAKAKQEIR